MSFNLKELFKSLHTSIEEATDVSRCSVNRWIDQFFEIDSDGKHIPKYAKMQLPVVENGVMVEKEINVPLYTLANHQSMSIDTLEIDFCVSLDDLQDKEAVASMFPMFKKESENKARIKMSFKGGDPAEGIMKINDALVKVIP
tara:strand:- start:69 stop:497 length:429 start_codon:yes stop_codon:yes gene_type:complete